MKLQDPSILHKWKSVESHMVSSHRPNYDRRGFEEWGNYRKSDHELRAGFTLGQDPIISATCLGPKVWNISNTFWTFLPLDKCITPSGWCKGENASGENKRDNEKWRLNHLGGPHTALLLALPLSFLIMGRFDTVYPTKIVWFLFDI